ncbi:MAG TPA: hypothetical protein DCS43_07135 [Verrucomicrobia bacterium]|nr:hypothetical protein [Verrucomicrobiota bacterium]
MGALFEHPVAGTLILVAASIAAGVAIGKIRWLGFQFGIGGVLFAGLFFGHLKVGPFAPEILHFVREFGLILFIYMIGIEIGPGFFASFRRHGLRLNLLALVYVLLGFGCAAVGGWLTGMDAAAMAGVMSGAVTNTPGLGEAQQVLVRLSGEASLADRASLAYAITYPFGIVGMILTMSLAKRVLRIDLHAEHQSFRSIEAAFMPSRTLPKASEHINIAPIFLGIVIGLIVGAIPIPVPGWSTSLRLGMAGGPLLVALVMGRIGRVGSVILAIHPVANRTLREIGIAMFLAVVGLTAGRQLIATLVHGEGVYWMLIGAVITLIPAALTILVARFLFKENFLCISGLLSGAGTNPPSLAYATHALNSSAPALVFATVYALAMFLRVFCAQVLVLLLNP